ncbi:MAG: aldehyde ferredoxin oxidoreductase C-terminal domain-containing protein [Desulfosarcinaceae bacterium]|nr:aldehyde ferredoxin oxidoreductase C-terminal domain-containing protein [Desulfosarcinaceae bacterium]
MTAMVSRVEAGRLLEVDLTSRRIRSISLGRTDLRRWLGGRAINVALLSRLVGKPIDPLGPENPLLFSAGLLVGSPAPSAARLHINAISPLTGLLGSSNVGGRFAPRLRECGFDTVVVTGAAPTPVTIEISRDRVRIRPADTLWGLDTHATHAALCAANPDEHIESLTIGPAGERLTRFACIVTDRDHAAGRTGLGAVMGCKRLKAIVLRATAGRAPGRYPKSSRPIVNAYFQKILDSPDYRPFAELGGAGYVRWAHEQGLMSTRNYSAVTFAEGRALDGAEIRPAVAGKRGCKGCPVKCKAILRFAEGRLKGRTSYRPEFEPMINLGAKCGLSDLQAVIHLDNLCTRLGLDSTSAATAIAFAMDLAQRGLLPEARRGGLDLSWGNSASMEILIRQMAAMEGLGGLLGSGVRAAALALGPDTMPYAAHVKGLELTAYHPAALLGSALGYAVSSRGGDYNNVYASLEHRWTAEQARQAFGTAKALDRRSYAGKGRLIHRAVLVNIIVDSLGICKVPVLSMIGTFDLVPEAFLTAALTGWNVTAADLFTVGTRVAHLERCVNLAQGLDPEQDDLPEMFFQEGPHRLDRGRFLEMVQEFYAAMDWDAGGRPSKEAIRSAAALLPVLPAA